MPLARSSWTTRLSWITLSGWTGRRRCGALQIQRPKYLCHPFPWRQRRRYTCSGRPVRMADRSANVNGAEAPFQVPREAFRQVWTSFALRTEASRVKMVMSQLGTRHLLRLPRKQSVAADEGGASTRRLVLLRYLAADCGGKNELPECSNWSREFVDRDRADLYRHLLAEETASSSTTTAAEPLSAWLTVDDLVTHDVMLDYSYFSAEYVLRRLLPESVTVPSSFEVVGSVLHLNLRAPQLPHARLIGQVLLDKHRHVQIVVNKAEMVGGAFRTFGMQTLAAHPGATLVTQVRENGCTFTLDFGQVYWNSRLETEHRRVIEEIGKAAVTASERFPVRVADAFAGVGPFAVPLARQDIPVYANDLNPDSALWLRRNLRKNHVPPGRCFVSCTDARAFLQHLLVTERVPVTHIIMNLPLQAPEFLPVLLGAIAPGRPMPRVFCYCFEGGEQGAQRAVDRVAAALAAPISASAEGQHVPEPKRVRPQEPFVFQAGRDEWQVRYVRAVAPNKAMFCVEFVLPERMGRAREALREAPSPER
ncbi:hypothetical protein CDCA_CDCA08G2378 [Cyanidium caldarium]|uniref:tRNA (guanine(37)-N1)-methyltransferase n=1 Tax=Cyanidium caldarium TaxID=2771 RepID=A0AAV9IVP3_CYACA|nr:hypothetical protein CDCA_CDCA08G2378 [Cyanidium caldarium]